MPIQAPIARVLVIEDEALVAQDIASIVTSMGLQVCGVVSRQAKALAKAVASKPDLILADITLQDGDDGIDTIRKIRHYLDVPVIFVTGHADRLHVEQGRPSVFYVAKPFMADTLRRAVSEALELN